MVIPVQLSFSATRAESGHFSHQDFANLTINTCIGGNFDGGVLNLYLKKHELAAMVPQRPEKSIFHNGFSFHTSNPLTSGFRQNLIRTRDSGVVKIELLTKHHWSVFFSAEPRFSFWDQLPQDVKANIAVFAPSVKILLDLHVTSKSTRQELRAREDLIWADRFLLSWHAPLPSGSDSPKEKFVKQYAGSTPV